MYEVKMPTTKGKFVGGKMDCGTITKKTTGEKFNAFQTGHGAWKSKKHPARNSKAAFKARKAMMAD